MSFPGNAVRRIGLLGGRVDLRSTKTELLDLVMSYFCEASSPPGDPDLEVALFWSENAAGCGRFRVETQPVQAFSDSAVPEPRSPFLLVRALTEWAVKQTSRHYVFHAGALAGPLGGLLLPGSTRSGKTTLTAGLLGRGFSFLSDEVGAFEFDSGLMTAFPRNLSIRNDVWSLLNLGKPQPRSEFEWHFPGGMVEPQRLGGEAFTEKITPALIVCPHFERGASVGVERMTAGAAVMALTAASCSVRRFKAAGLDFVIDLVKRIPCYELHFGEFEAGLDALEQLYAAGEAG